MCKKITLEYYVACLRPFIDHHNIDPTNEDRRLLLFLLNY